MLQYRLQRQAYCSVEYASSSASAVTRRDIKKTCFEQPKKDVNGKNRFRTGSL